MKNVDGIDPAIAHKRLALFPHTMQVQQTADGARLSIAGLDLELLADRFGTPLYLYDEVTLNDSLATYQNALKQSYPGSTGITYAGKAFLCVAMAQWVKEQGLWLDCTGEGELAFAVAARLAPEQILVHGVSKTRDDLFAAFQYAGTVVVDNLEELKTVVKIYQDWQQPGPAIWLRLRPGETVATHHEYTQTGYEDSKFGMSLEEAARSVQICLDAHLPVNGLHFHLGSHFVDFSPLSYTIETVLDFVVAMRMSWAWLPSYLSPGGGWGVAYVEDDLPNPPVDQYIQSIAHSLQHGCLKRSLPLPHLQFEPGRSLVAQAGVALYRVQAIKETAHRRWLLLDGGMADNIRPALYRARYTALPVVDPLRPILDLAWLGGPFCESSDVLIEALPMPEIQPGQLIAVPVSGAYHLSMSSNYNGARRPAVLWLNNGQTTLIQRRETVEDLIQRDFPIS
jgi:diaminopimelate decarboxylase